MRVRLPFGKTDSRTTLWRIFQAASVYSLHKVFIKDKFYHTMICRLPQLFVEKWSIVILWFVVETPKVRLHQRNRRALIHELFVKASVVATGYPYRKNGLGTIARENH